MKKISIFISGMILVAIMFIIAQTVFADVPFLINYKGRLRQNGQPVSGTRTLEFRIYDAATAGTFIWTSGEQSVNISTGVYSYQLGTDNPGGGSTTQLADISWSSGNYWLEIYVNSVKFSPRERFTSAPYAFVANQLYGNNVVTTSAGRLGVGTTNPGTDRVYITGDASTALVIDATSSPRLRFEVSGSAKSYLWYNNANGYTGIGDESTVAESIIIKDTGDVGLGTITPGYKLDVQGSGGNPAIGGRLNGTDDGALRVGYTSNAPAGHYATYAP